MATKYHQCSRTDKSPQNKFGAKWCTLNPYKINTHNIFEFHSIQFISKYEQCNIEQLLDTVLQRKSSVNVHLKITNHTRNIKK